MTNGLSFLIFIFSLLKMSVVLCLISKGGLPTFLLVVLDNIPGLAMPVPLAVPQDTRQVGGKVLHHHTLA